MYGPQQSQVEEWVFDSIVFSDGSTIRIQDGAFTCTDIYGHNIIPTTTLPSDIDAGEF